MFWGGRGRAVGYTILGILFSSTVAYAAGRQAVRRTGDDIVPGVVIVAMRDGASALTTLSPGGSTAPVSAFRKAGVQSARQIFSSVFMVQDAKRASALSRLGRIFECAIPAGADPRAARPRWLPRRKTR